MFVLFSNTTKTDNEIRISFTKLWNNIFKKIVNEID